MSRDWRVDTLRGYFLVIMAIAHLPTYPWQGLTFYTFGYASAPDGFVFLSGLVSTWVYLRAREKHGESAMRARALWRARDIYLVHIALLWLGTAGAVLCRKSSFAGMHPFQAVIRGSLLLYQPRLSDILPMYCVFLLFTPFVLNQMAKGRAWLIGLISASLWTAAQFGVGDASSKLVPWIQGGSFNILAWQAYFVAGQYFGYRTIRGGSIPKLRLLLVVCCGVALFLLVDRHSQLFFGVRPLLRFGNQPDRSLVRFLDAACLGYILCWIPRSVDQKLMKLRIFRFVNELGKHSLQVFAFSLFVTFAATALSSRWDGLPGAVKLAFVVFTVLSLAIPARLHEIYREYRASGQVVFGYPKILQGQSANVL